MFCEKHPWVIAAYMRIVPAYRKRNPSVFVVCEDCHREAEKIRHQQPEPFTPQQEEWLKAA